MPLFVIFVKRKPPALPVVPKSFSFAQIIYPSEARNRNSLLLEEKVSGYRLTDEV